MKKNIYVSLFATILAFCVVVLGAYTRLTQAGLGCPDWPGCYGHMVMPTAEHAIAGIKSSFKVDEVEPIKAWTEMVHRYCAGILICLIAYLLYSSYINRKSLTTFQKLAMGCLSLIIILQAILGMWTVTLKLYPLVVTSHLIGGFSVLTALFCLYLSFSSTQKISINKFILLGLVILSLQIFLGGWVSTNYAGVSCIGLPFCNNNYMPHGDFSNAFHFFSPLGINYEGGVLDNAARAAIQTVHRVWAIFTFVYLLSISLYFYFKSKCKDIKNAALIVVVILCLQCLLGVANVIYLLPLKSAVPHNGVAALLLLSVIFLFNRVGREDL